MKNFLVMGNLRVLVLVLDIIYLEKIYIPKHDREYCLKEKCSRENKKCHISRLKKFWFSKRARDGYH